MIWIRAQKLEKNDRMLIKERWIDDSYWKYWSFGFINHVDYLPIQALILNN